MEVLGKEEGENIMGKCLKHIFPFKLCSSVGMVFNSFVSIVVIDPSFCNHHAFPIEETENR